MRGLDFREIQPRNDVFVSGNKPRPRTVWTANKFKGYEKQTKQNHGSSPSVREEFRALYGKGTKGSGWFSFDQRGVHFIGLVNVMNIAEGGLGILGEDQLAWLKDDVKSTSGCL